MVEFGINAKGINWKHKKAEAPGGASAVLL